MRCDLGDDLLLARVRVNPERRQGGDDEESRRRIGSDQASKHHAAPDCTRKRRGDESQHPDGGDGNAQRGRVRRAVANAGGRDLNRAVGEEDRIPEYEDRKAAKHERDRLPRREIRHSRFDVQKHCDSKDN